MRGLILKKLASEERKLGESLDYVRHILRVSFGAFLKFTKILSIAEYRRTLPPAAKHVAAIVAARDEDCGTCVQIGVNLAKADGVSTEILHAVIDRRPELLDDALADVYRFTEAVIGSTGEESPLRECLTQHFGERGVVELALTIASSRFFPIVKRSLGFSTSCALVTIKI